MIISMFDQTKIRKDDGHISNTPEGEAVRLSNELRAMPARTYLNPDGIRVDVPAKRGFDCETADFQTMIDWLADTRIKKSNSLVMFVYRILAVRFPTEYAQNKSNIDNRLKLEYELIQSNAKNDVFWFGEVGFSGLVRLDGSLNRNNNRSVKQRNGEIKIVKK